MVAASSAQGQPAEVRTLPWVATLIEEPTRGEQSLGPRVLDFRRNGRELPPADPACNRAERRGYAGVDPAGLAQTKKNGRENCTIVVAGESRFGGRGEGGEPYGCGRGLPAVARRLARWPVNGGKTG